MAMYAGVTRPRYRGKYRGWLAQHRTPRVWRMGFSTEVLAAQWLAKQLKVTVQSLNKNNKKVIKNAVVKKRVVHVRASCYEGVVFHRTANSAYVRWEAWAHGGLLGTYVSELEAAERVADEVGVDKDDLRKVNGVMSAAVAKDVFKAAFQVFRGYRPGDLTSVEAMEVKYEKLFRKDARANREHPFDR
jgi:hypothetical protein